MTGREDAGKSGEKERVRQRNCTSMISPARRDRGKKFQFARRRRFSLVAKHSRQAGIASTKLVDGIDFTVRQRRWRRRDALCRAAKEFDSRARRRMPDRSDQNRNWQSARRRG